MLNGLELHFNCGHASAAESPLQFVSAYLSSSSHLQTCGVEGEEGKEEVGEDQSRYREGERRERERKDGRGRRERRKK